MRNNIKTNPERYKHWAWYEATAPGYERSNGRLALSYDLRNGNDQSKFWVALQNALKELNKPVVRVIGSTFDDTASGMLVDVVYLVQQQMKMAGDVQLWLMGPVGREWSERIEDRTVRISADEQVRRTLATLRELERFQRNTSQLFQFVHEGSQQELLRQTYDFAVVQTVFLFESSLDSQARNPSPEDGPLATMADCLTALMQKSANQSLAGFISDRRDNASRVARRNYIGLVSGIGSFTLRTPGWLIEQAIQWRMLRDTLFERSLGLLVMEVCDFDKDGEFIPLEKATVNYDELDRYYTEATELLAATRGENTDLNLFYHLITLRLNELLSGDFDRQENLVARRNGLQRAADWLARLRTVLLDQDRNQDLPKVDHLIKQVKDWQDFLQAKIYPRCVQGWQDARSQMERLRRQNSRRWVIDLSLEWDTYNTLVRKWRSEPTSNLADERLLRLASHFGWRMIYNDLDQTWSLQFLATPPGFNWQPGFNVEQLALSKDDPEAFIEAMVALSAPLARVHKALESEVLREELGRSDAARKDKISEIVARSRPALVNMNDSEATIDAESVKRMTMLVVSNAADRSYLQSLITSNQNLSGNRMAACESSDQTAVSLIQVCDWVPNPAIQSYNKETWNSPPQSSLYVQAAEQQAAVVESSWSGDDPDQGVRRLTSRFVSWLAQDANLVKDYAQAMIYGLIFEKNGEIEIPPLGYLDGCTVGQALGMLLEDLDAHAEVEARREEILKFWETNVESCKKKTVSTRAADLRAFKKNVIDRLAQSEQPVDKDLAAYLAAQVELEG